jgi:uncharacterized protein (DUF362 family)
MIKRREFLKGLIALISVLSGCIGIKDKKNVIEEASSLENSLTSKVYLIKTGDRGQGINELLNYFDLGSVSGKKVAIKANFNSSDRFPASTHIDTLKSMVRSLKDNGATIVLAERSGMGNTRKVFEDTGVIELAEKEGFEVVVLDDLKSSDWVLKKPEESHWKKGFLFPKVFEDADIVVQTCCFKTHGYGGHFTMSLKNSVGMVAKDDPDDGYNYMSELHSSRYQRLMIAEINTAYQPELVIMDAISGFGKGGPGTGTLIEPGLIIASSDRVALDAVGVALLRIYGTTSDVSEGTIFQQEQIARAAELGLGVTSTEDIQIIPVNDEAKNICTQIEKKLAEA